MKMRTARRMICPTSLPLRREPRARAPALAVGFLAARRLLRLVGRHATTLESSLLMNSAQDQRAEDPTGERGDTSNRRDAVAPSRVCAGSEHVRVVAPETKDHGQQQDRPSADQQQCSGCSKRKPDDHVLEYRRHARPTSPRLKCRKPARSLPRSLPPPSRDANHPTRHKPARHQRLDASSPRSPTSLDFTRTA